MTNNWLSILKAAVQRSSQGQVASQLNYSRATISLVLADKYPGNTKHIQQKVIKKLATVECPHTGVVITMTDCYLTAHGKAPTHNPAKMAQWRACRVCKNNCKNY